MQSCNYRSIYLTKFPPAISNYFDNEPEDRDKLDLRATCGDTGNVIAQPDLFCHNITE